MAAKPNKGVKKGKPIKPRDTVRVKTTAGYPIIVKIGSSYHRQAQEIGAVISQHRPGADKRTEENDPLSVKNYKKRLKRSR